MPLSDEEIQEITRSVIERLRERSVGDTASVPTGPTKAVPPGPSREDSGAGDTELTRPSPMTVAGHAYRGAHPENDPQDHQGKRIIVATFGRNRPGVAAALTAVLAEYNCSIADITQKILQEFFSMIMIVDIGECTIDFAALREKFAEIESRLGIQITAQHEDVFRAMHRV